MTKEEKEYFLEYIMGVDKIPETKQKKTKQEETKQVLDYIMKISKTKQVLDYIMKIPETKQEKIKQG